MLINTFIKETSNYITEQHNTLSDWLHENLCIIYKALNGSCDRTIGPLNENQAHIPMQLYWPEGQLTIFERLEQFQTHLSLPVSDNDEAAGAEGMEAVRHVMMNAFSLEMKGRVDAVADLVENKMNALSKEMQGKDDALETKVDAVETKVDAVETKVDAVETKVDAVADLVESKVNVLSKEMQGKVDAMKDELKEVKDLINKLMSAMTKD